MIAQNPSLSARGSRALALAAAAVALFLAGCGRIGPLQPPPDPNAPPKPAVTPTSAESLTPMVKPSIPPIVAPERSFFLDPLLK